MPFIATAVAIPAATTVSTSSAWRPRSALPAAPASGPARHAMNNAASTVAAVTATAAGWAETNAPSSLTVPIGTSGWGRLDLDVVAARELLAMLIAGEVLGHQHPPGRG